MQFPFVSRDRYNEAVAREERQLRRIQDLENKMLALVDKMVALKPPTVSVRAEPSSFALPGEVVEAIAARSHPGSKTEKLLRLHAEKRLANGATEVSEVVTEIMAGSDAFTEDEW